MKYIYCEIVYDDFLSYVRANLQNKKLSLERFLFRVNDSDNTSCRICSIGGRRSSIKKIAIFSSEIRPVSIICETINIEYISIQSLWNSLEIGLKDGQSFTQFIDAKIIEFDSDNDAKLWFEMRDF